MRKHPHRGLAITIAGLGIALAACGSATDTAGSGEDQPGMNMCAPGVADCDDTAVDGGGDPFAACPVGTPDCNDTPGDTAADCESGVQCDDTETHEVSGEEPATVHDERMNPSIPIVQAFVAPDTKSVEMAPGSLADPMRLFLQEAVVDGRQVQVSFTGGEAPCFVVDHVDVDEQADFVVVTVWAGSPDSSACTSERTGPQSIMVVLDADLGSRPLFDGSRMQGADNV